MDFTSTFYSDGLREMAATYSRLAADLTSLAKGHLPYPAVTIDDWIIVKRAVPCLLGTMNSHPSIHDGKGGVTSELIYIDQSLGIARTTNRWYSLGSLLVQQELQS
ncbi:hypothetical protein [Agrobacterium pusense]|uniref:hypothetical protein n=1 Tax=Agrobacterium TaxID=357 RepID=UPI000D342AC0|nr:hypothetical protein [Agrobacterium pusense]PTV72478.1 hypothetical protein DBL06_20055 [Agrobacterium pusense]